MPDSSRGDIEAPFPTVPLLRSTHLEQGSRTLHRTNHGIRRTIREIKVSVRLHKQPGLDRNHVLILRDQDKTQDCLVSMRLQDAVIAELEFDDKVPLVPTRYHKTLLDTFGTRQSSILRLGLEPLQRRVCCNISRLDHLTEQQRDGGKEVYVRRS
eukprot:748065-Hanusia_phi.AAC.2